jgi:hypothetical protein
MKWKKKQKPITLFTKFWKVAGVRVLLAKTRSKKKNFSGYSKLHDGHLRQAMSNPGFL